MKELEYATSKLSMQQVHFLLQVLPSNKLSAKVTVSINQIKPLLKLKYVVLALYYNN